MFNNFYVGVCLRGCVGLLLLVVFRNVWSDYLLFFCYSRLITFIYWRVTELHRRRAEKGFCFYGHVLCWFLITIFRRANLFDKRERDFDTYLDT